MKYKIYILLISSVIFLSCAKHSATDPRIDNTNNDEIKAVTIGNGYYGTIYYMDKSFTGMITKTKVEELWRSILVNQTLYKDSEFKDVNGIFKDDISYYEDVWDSGKSARAVYKKCLIYHYKGKDYIGGIYWDNKTGVGLRIRYRLIIMDENGVQQAWYGGGSSENVIPDENTSDWVKYWFPLGYMKLDN